MNDDAGGHRSAIVWSVPKDDAAGWLSLSDDDFAAEAEAAMGGFLGKIEMLAPRSTFPLGFHHAAQMTASGWRWSAMPPTPSIRSPDRASTSASAMSPRWPQVLVEGARLGLDLGDAQLLARYQRWRSLDALLGRVRDRQPHSDLRGSRRRLRRPPLGHGSGRSYLPLANRFMSEARGTSGDLPLLLRGLPI